MDISKVNGSFNEYKLELSYNELVAIRDALSKHHAGPIADELYSGVLWYLDKLPPPGVEEEDEDDDEKSPAKKHSKEPSEVGLPDPDEDEQGGEEESEEGGGAPEDQGEQEPEEPGEEEFDDEPKEDKSGLAGDETGDEYDSEEGLPEVPEE